MYGNSRHPTHHSHQAWRAALVRDQVLQQGPGLRAHHEFCMHDVFWVCELQFEATMGVEEFQDHLRGRHRDIVGKTELRSVAEGNEMAAVFAR